LSKKSVEKNQTMEHLRILLLGIDLSGKVSDRGLKANARSLSRVDLLAGFWRTKTPRPVTVPN
jgi:hypothetical protein